MTLDDGSSEDRMISQNEYLNTSDQKAEQPDDPPIVHLKT